MKINQVKNPVKVSIIKPIILVGAVLVLSGCASSLQKNQKQALTVNVQDLEFNASKQGKSKREINRDLKQEADLSSDSDLKVKRYIKKKINRVKNRKLTPADYISIFGRVAVQEMRKYKIPASITLAQGLLESGFGNGRLAKEGNNHFGIKCHGWRGKKIYHDDDKKGECFRKYRNPYNSYRDHSIFLRRRSRYNSLFELDIKDYKGWARDLQKAGYATAQDYAQKLINLIQRYKLYKFDSIKKSKWKNRVKQTKLVPAQRVHKDSATTLTQALAQIDTKPTEVNTKAQTPTLVFPKPPQVPNVGHPKAQVPILVSPKPSQTPVPIKASKLILGQKTQTHIVKAGETLYSISRRYKTTVENLKNLNKLPNNTIKIGQSLTVSASN